jgi:hypothetical protein
MDKTKRVTHGEYFGYVSDTFIGKKKASAKHNVTKMVPCEIKITDTALPHSAICLPVGMKICGTFGSIE